MSKNLSKHVSKEEIQKRPTGTWKNAQYYQSLKWSRSVVSDSLQPHGLQSPRLLCWWDFPGKSTGVGCHFLLQGIFPTRGLNPGLLHCRRTLYPLSHEGSREKQLKPQCDITPHLLEWSWSTKEERTNAGVNVEKREFLYTIDGIISWLQTPWKTVWSFLKNLKIKLRDLVIRLLGLYPRP